MSVIDTFHNVIPFVSGESKPLNGQRLARALYKKDSAFKSICASVPQIPVSWASDSRLIPAIVGMLEESQDKILKGIYEARKGSLDRVADSEIGIDAIIGFLESEKNGDRISAESISAWFHAHVQNSLIVILAEKLGFSESKSDSEELSPEQEDTLFRELGKIKNILGLLAAKSAVSFSEQQKRAISRCFEISSIDSDSGFQKKLKEKFDAMQGKVKEDVLDF